MSSQNVENVIVEKIPKKPAKYLPAKYNKYAVFTFWLCEKLGQECPEAVDIIKSITNLTSRDVPTQIGFYEQFVSEEKIHAKALRALIMEKKPKVQKEKKPRKPRVSKKNAIVEQVTNNDIISQIVSRANSIDMDNETVELPLDIRGNDASSEIQDQENKIVGKQPKEKVVKEPKQPKEKVVKEPKQPKEKVVKEPKQPKEKVVKEPKEKVVKEPKPPKEKVVKEPKQPKEKVVKEKVVKEPKEPKEKVVKEPKKKVVNKMDQHVEQELEQEVVVEEEVEVEEVEVEEVEEEEEELQVEIVMIEGVQRYQDTDGNLYDLDFNMLNEI